MSREGLDDLGDGSVRRERRRAPPETTARDAPFRAAIEAMLDSVVMTTAVRGNNGHIEDFVVDYANPVAEIRLGSAGQIPGRRFLEVWPAAGQSPIWAMYLHLMETGEPVVLDNFAYTEVIDGRPVAVVCDIRATRVGDGFLQTFRDVTERQRMQEALAASEKRFRSAVHAVGCPFFILAPVRQDDGRIIELEYKYLNRAALQLYGVSEPEVIGHGLLELFPSVRELGIFDSYLDALETGVPARIDVPYFDENGVAGSFDLAVTPSEESLIIAAHDVSGARQAQEALTVLNAELEERVSQRTSELLRAEADSRALEASLSQAERLQTVGQLTSSIAHDFKNLLAVIVGYAEMAEEISNDPDPEMARVLAEIRDAADRAVHLASDLLNFRGRARTRPEAIDVNALVTGMRDLLNVSMSGRAELRFEPAPALPAVWADRNQIEQVLLNLAVNARDAMPEGGALTIRTARADFGQEHARLHPDVSRGRYVEIMVGDTGTGMSANVSARIFDRFFTTKPAGTGTGLGLSTVHGIVTDAGGTIEVETAEGRGTAFRIYLPAISTAPDLRNHGLTT